MNTTVLARSPPAGFSFCPKSSNNQGEKPIPSPVKTQLSAVMQSLQIAPLQRAAPMLERTQP